MEQLVFNTAEHKLEELEKYGFEKYISLEFNYDVAYVRYTNKVYCAIVGEITPWFTIWDIDIIFYKERPYEPLKRVNKKKLLKDLIKDGLVVKEKK